MNLRLDGAQVHWFLCSRKSYKAKTEIASNQWAGHDVTEASAVRKKSYSEGFYNQHNYVEMMP